MKFGPFVPTQHTLGKASRHIKSSADKRVNEEESNSSTADPEVQVSENRTLLETNKQAFPKMNITSIQMNSSMLELTAASCVYLMN